MAITKINRMYILSFIFTLHISLSAYVNSTFLAKTFSERYVGILYTIGSIATLVLLCESANILKKLGNRRFILSLFVVNMASIAGLIATTNPYSVGLSFIALTTSNTLIFFCIDIFIEHFGNPATIGKTRGLYLTVINIAWMMSPLITAFLINREGGYIAIYTISFIATALSALGLIFSVKRFRDTSYKRIGFLTTYHALKKNSSVYAITIINFILQFFYAWMVVYTPIYLIKHIGFAWAELGIIFTIMLVPFVIFGLPIGILIDKYRISKRTLLAIGFLIMILSTAAISIISIKSIILWALVLFMTRVGATIVETTSEIYFFTHVREDEAYLLGVFRDMAPVGYIIAPLVALFIFAFAPFKMLFIVLSIIMCAGFYYIARLKEHHG